MLNRRAIDLELEKIESRLNGISAIPPGNVKAFEKNATASAAVNHSLAIIDAIKTSALYILRDFKESMRPDSIFADLMRLKILPDEFDEDGDKVIATTAVASKMSSRELSAFMVKAETVFINYVRYLRKYLKDRKD